MNKQVMRGMKFAMQMLGWLILALPVQAASFDCAKAQSKVEHLICDNPEISKLDDELAASYKSALHDRNKAIEIKQVQKQWLANRNGCSDVNCLKIFYVERLATLRSTNSVIVKSSFTGQWHLSICDAKIGKNCGGFTVYLIQSGSKICGDHFFSTPGGGRLNEGAPRSIIGTIADENVANIMITSGRNGAVFKVHAIENGDILNWEVFEEVKHGYEDDSALVLNKGKLKREVEDANFHAALSACQKIK